MIAMTMKQATKNFIGHSFFRTGAYRRLYKQKAVISLFHRVDDRLGDNPISCTVKQFRTYSDFFRDYFHVVPLAELVGKLQRGEDISQHLAITFDDGYKDNSMIAAEELQKRKLPGCFFVVTDFIETDRVPWWDAKLGIQSRWMNWADVRMLKAAGFEVGAHTVNHLDLGEIEGAEAESEIVGSKKRLDHELQTDTRLFSYPFGGRHQMKESNRDIVRKIGFSCCLSAFGGIVTNETDLFHIPRVPVSQWFVSPYQFGIEAWRS